MKRFSFILILTACFANACAFNSNSEKANSSSPNTANSANSNAEKSSSGGAVTNQTSKQSETAKSNSNADCQNIKIAGKELDKKQTFTFDFEPFKNACFVTAHDPEFDDPPLGSEFFIYQDGREVYKFPTPFNGVTTGCWAEAVAFQDLNEDGLTDIVIAGMCSAKTAPYSENMVYVNKGKSFTTNEDANYTLEKFKKIKDIIEFVKSNKEQFFQ